MNNQLEKKCAQHDQEFQAANIGLDNNDKNNYKCPQCLYELINPQEMILINESKRQLEKKNKQIFEYIEEQSKKKINLANNLKNSVSELKGPLKQQFSKINGEIDLFKNQTEDSDIIPPENLEIDLTLLTDEQRKFQLDKVLEKDSLLLKSLLNQSQFSEISSLTKQKLIEIIAKNYEIPKLHIESEDERNQKTKSTPALKFLCQRHDQQIIMVQLNEKNQFQNYSCVQCISEKQGKYITLLQLQQSFETYYKLSGKSLKYCQQLREQHTNEIIKICNQLRNKYIETINLLIKQLEENYKSFEKIINTNLQFKDQNILLFEQEQLLQILKPIYEDDNPNHYFKLIEKQLELDKELNFKFEQQMQELIEFKMHNLNVIKLEQFNHQIILKKVENQIESQKLYQQDEEINSEILYNNQTQLIQNIVKLQDTLKRQQNCAKEQTSFAQNFQTKIKYLESLTTLLNSYSFCNQIQKEVQIQTNETIASTNLKINEYKEKISELEQEVQSLKKETLSLILSNPYQPQFNNSYKFTSYQVVNSKLVSDTQKGFGLAIMQPPLPKDKVTSFILKINKYDQWAGIGICHLQTAQSFGYDISLNYQQKNHNTYLLFGGGFRMSSYQGYTTGINFTYSASSFIHCQYDPINCKLNLLHINDGKTYQLDLGNNSLEMSPCVVLFGAEIERI
ncbi:unnamed protein product [Paramecium sonneborni]|uniref:Uncharacterized protein n=1 Tax=Paramecium sonneborni TaxID=65129 RepID=A0A8S1RQG1_9CILI|nr:unnamed protein product [Paramecium sonneborni]